MLHFEFYLASGLHSCTVDFGRAVTALYTTVVLFASSYDIVIQYGHLPLLAFKVFNVLVVESMQTLWRRELST